MRIMRNSVAYCFPQLSFLLSQELLALQMTFSSCLHIPFPLFLSDSVSTSSFSLSLSFFFTLRIPFMLDGSVICPIVSNSATPWTVASRLLCPWDSPGKNTGVGFHALLQGIFPTQGSSQPRDQTPVSCTAGGFFTN